MDEEHTAHRNVMLPALMLLMLGCGGTTGQQVLWGTGGADSLRGTETGDLIVCQAGDDEVRGALGNDVIQGGLGNDVLHGDEGDDRIEGGPGGDVLFGDDGDDRIDGGPGVDTLIGGAGADRLIGGPGADRFVFSVGAAETGVDTIEDFRVDEGDVAVVAGIDVADGPVENNLRIVQGTLQVLVDEASRWLPVVRLGPVKLSVNELVKRKAIVPRVSVDF